MDDNAAAADVANHSESPAAIASSVYKAPPPPPRAPPATAPIVEPHLIGLHAVPPPATVWPIRSPTPPAAPPITAKVAIPSDGSSAPIKAPLPAPYNAATAISDADPPCTYAPRPPKMPPAIAPTVAPINGSFPVGSRRETGFPAAYAYSASWRYVRVQRLR